MFLTLSPQPVGNPLVALWKGQLVCPGHLDVSIAPLAARPKESDLDITFLAGSPHIFLPTARWDFEAGMFCLFLFLCSIGPVPEHVLANMLVTLLLS